MKTAISLADDLLKEADRTAHAMGLSRSRLFSVALEDYLRRQRQEQMMAQLNQVYSGHPDPSEARIVRGIKKTVQRTIKDRW